MRSSRCECLFSLSLSIYIGGLATIERRKPTGLQLSPGLAEGWTNFQAGSFPCIMIVMERRILTVIVSELFDPLSPLINRFFEAIVLLSKKPLELMANVVVDNRFPIPHTAGTLPAVNSASTRFVVGVEGDGTCTGAFTSFSPFLGHW